MKIFFDCEFTSLSQDAKLISIGLITENNDIFYAELTDTLKFEMTDWLKSNVLPNLKFSDKKENGIKKAAYAMSVYGDRDFVSDQLREWLMNLNIDKIEMWSDVLAYDWVLFVDLLCKSSVALPPNIYYIPFDLATVFKIKGIDPDISRKEYSGLTDVEQHNALDDAIILKKCYEKLMGD